MFLETSALTGAGIQDIYVKCARTILTKIEQGINFWFFWEIKLIYLFLGILDPDVAGSGVQRGDSGEKKEVTAQKKPQPEEGGCC